MAILTSPANAETLPHGPWLARAQGAAIFTGSVNLFSTALANFGLVVFLLLFLCVLVGPERRSLAWSTFPRWVALAIGLYLGWQAIGILYTDAPRDYAWESLYADRKILYILPLALLFGGGSFSVKFEPIAVGMGEQKLENALETGAEYLISTDVSCLMHIDGYAKKVGKNMKMMHLCDVLASGWD